MVDDDALWRETNAVLLRKEIARQSVSVRVDKSRPAVETMTVHRIKWPVDLKMVKGSGARARDKDSPNVAKTIRSIVQRNNQGRFFILRSVV